MPPPPPVAAAAPSRADWTAGCNRIIDNIMKNLGPVDAPIFYEPVNPAQVPDYHQVVKRPVCLKDIRHRLSTGQYAGPEGFYQVRAGLAGLAGAADVLGGGMTAFSREQQRWPSGYRLLLRAALPPWDCYLWGCINLHSRACFFGSLVLHVHWQAIKPGF